MMNSRSDLFCQDLILSDPDFVWSYSRISKYDECKYGWYLHYVEEMSEENLFLSEFGTFIHQIYAMVLSGDLLPENALDFFLSNFRDNVTHRAPNESIFKSYFDTGVRAVSNMKSFVDGLSDFSITGVEQNFKFKVGGYNFVGFVDLLLENKDGDYIIVDHKSRILKPKSNRAKPTQADILLDKYLRQLNIYAEAVNQTYGKYPVEMWFNCFRNSEKNIIKVPFHLEELKSTVEWVTKTIEDIKYTEEWTPNCDYFYCRNLCGNHNNCEYFETMNGR